MFREAKQMILMPVLESRMAAASWRSLKPKYDCHDSSTGGHKHHHNWNWDCTVADGARINLNLTTHF